MPIKHFVSIDDLSQQEIEAVFTLADRILDSEIENVGFVLDFILRFLDVDGRPSRKQASRASCAGKILGVAFYEPSTRTRLSFESAMLRLGGSVIGFAGAAASSVAKGESLADTIKVISSYCDVMVLRHPIEGAARWASENSRVPLINAGDGAHEHPTQTVLDLFTIRREKGRIAGLTIGMLGDLKYGRTVHSLSLALIRAGARVILISPPSLRMPDAILNRLRQENGDSFVEGESLGEFLPELDALYVTRIQRERFSDPQEYEKVRGAYVVDQATMRGAPPDALVLHPLPRVGEIAPSFDTDPRAVYFRQAAYGVPVRMALIALLVAASASEAGEKKTAPSQSTQESMVCSNDRCVTRSEPDVAPRFIKQSSTGRVICHYCDHPVAGAVSETIEKESAGTVPVRD